MGFSIGKALSSGLKGFVMSGGNPYAAAAAGVQGGMSGDSDGAGGAVGGAMDKAGQAMKIWGDTYKEQMNQQQPWYQPGRGAAGNLSYLMGTAPKSSFGDKYELDKEGKQTFMTPEHGGYGELARRFTMDDYEADPGYQFRLDEGTKALERANAARGGFLGGQALKGLADYNQGMASQEYGNAFDRWRAQSGDIYSRLMGQSEQGRASANQMGAYGGQYANAMSGILGQQANLGLAQGINNQNQQNQGLGSLFGSGIFGGGGSQYGGGDTWRGGGDNPAGNIIWK